MTKQSDFLQLYDQSHEQFTKYCHAMVGDVDEAKDLISEAVLKAYEQFDKIKKPNSFVAYIIGIARRIYLNKLRSQKFQVRLSSTKTNEIVDSNAKTDLSIEVILLYEALSKLPKKQREAIILFEINGFSIADISNIQNSGQSAVKARLRRGRNSLRTLLLDKDSDKDTRERDHQKDIINC